MSRWLRDFRLMPIVLVAIGCLFALKTLGLVSGDGYTLGQRLGGGSGALVVTTVPAAPVTQLRSPAVPLEVASALRTRPAPQRIPYGGLLASLQDERDGPRKPAPRTLLTPELRTAARRELVEPGFPIAGGDTPLRTDPSPALETLQGGIERSLRHLQDGAGDLLQPFRDRPAVQRLL